MDDNRDDVQRSVRRKDTAEYSASKAPETRREAEEQTGPSDDRLRPGGAHGASADVGMSGVDHDATVSGGRISDQDQHNEGD